MNEHLHTSPQGLDFIKSFEGFFSKTYICPAGVPTIGYGHTNLSGTLPKVVTGGTMTKAEATRVLADDLAAVYEPAVRRQVKVPLTQNQWDVLVSFTYNCGEGNLKKSSLLRLLNQGDYKAVPEALMGWNRGGGQVLAGLTRRRKAEGQMWVGSGNTSVPSPALPKAPTAPKAGGNPKSDSPVVVGNKPAPVPTIVKVTGGIGAAVLAAFYSLWEHRLAVGLVVVGLGVAYGIYAYSTRHKNPKSRVDFPVS